MTAARAKLLEMRNTETAWDISQGGDVARAAVFIGEAGVTLSELLVALTIALVVSAGVVKLADDARTFFLVQPEVMDVTQRARVGVDLLIAELTSAGAGASLGADAGPLIRWMPPVIPSRAQGSGASDPAGQVFADRLTIVTAAESVPLVAVRGEMTDPAAAVPIAGPAGQAGCPVGDNVCGFRDGMRIAVFDRTTAFDFATLRTPVALPAPPPGSAQLFHDSSALTKAFREGDDARVVQIRAVTYYHDAVRNQLRRATGPRADAPVLDDVVGVSFRYFGDRAPPSSPRPSVGSANCLFDAHGVPALPALPADDGDQVELTQALLTDGPWCAGVDADLYRLRRIRVTLRVQANAAWARGRDPNLFQRPGTGTTIRLLVPDHVITFDVSPRNLSSG
jgi:hypothetical protein